MAQLFPEWSNKVPRLLLIGTILLLTFIVFGFWYFASPKFTDVGYAPIQPIDYSHKLHAGELGIDCRYCHSSVEVSAVAGIPSAQTCMNCHTQILPDSEDLELLRESWETGVAIEWVKVHDLPEYTYFNHAAHVNVGVGCESCHGRIDRMEVVMQAEPMSMGWCLDCHNNPEPHIRPIEEVFTMGWQAPENQFEFASEMITRMNIAPPIYCNACHR
ncbi:MAG: alternative complex III molybdopterin oxidoreductase pentaheme c subunit ActA [Bacteroidetes bacterium HLUCCA01]|nr:MAG: alternative complex III molybdopterin oxidoreductase pentaheme c subunit ActA [Bacteroidetes bacterium HLUCCA01]